jgi:hypothetical protein
VKIELTDDEGTQLEDERRLMTGESQPTYGRGGGVEVPSMAGGWRCGGDGGQRRRLKDYHFTVATHGHFASRTKKKWKSVALRCGVCLFSQPKNSAAILNRKKVRKSG